METEDVVKFGLIPEFVGRFHIVVPLHCLNEDHLVKILTETKNSLIAQKEFLLAYDEVQYITGIKLENMLFLLFTDFQ